jgi:hypothetical protein
MISVCRVVDILGKGRRLNGFVDMAGANCSVCDKCGGDCDGEYFCTDDVDPKLVKELTEIVSVFVAFVLRDLYMSDVGGSDGITVGVIVDGYIEENAVLMEDAKEEEPEADKE